MALACPNASGHRRRAHSGRAVRCNDPRQAAQQSAASSCLPEHLGVHGAMPAAIGQCNAASTAPPKQLDACIMHCNIGAAGTHWRT